MEVGDKVSKQGGDYRFDGVIVSKFKKLAGQERFVVEDDRGILHIYSAKNLMPQEVQPPSAQDQEKDEMLQSNSDRWFLKQ